MSPREGSEGSAVRVRAGGRDADYDVIVRPGVLKELPALLAGRAPAHRYAVISDETVAALHGGAVVDAIAAEGAEVELVTFPAGERHKTRETWSGLTDRLLAAGCARDSVVVAVGGGVTGDLAGFVAATFMRGIPVVQVPTSVVAMVDASVGGKTGVDVSAGKNLVGAFHPPRFVAVDPATIETLPRVERARGFAEAVKHGAIVDRGYFDELAARADGLLQGDVSAVEEAVLRSVAIKADVVSRDEREGGVRQVLNFGHTLGHALEAASAYALGHGEAVAVGMVLEARLGERLGATAPGTAATLAGALERFELPTDPGAALGDAVPDPGTLLGFTRTDKKVRAGRARYVVLEALGTVARADGAWSREVPDEAVVEVLREAVGAARPGGS